MVRMFAMNAWVKLIPEDVIKEIKMSQTTFRRTSFCLTFETERQLKELCTIYKENPSQVITRSLQLMHFSLRFPHISSDEIKELEKCEHL